MVRILIALVAAAGIFASSSAHAGDLLQDLRDVRDAHCPQVAESIACYHDYDLLEAKLSKVVALNKRITSATAEEQKMRLEEAYKKAFVDWLRDYFGLALFIE